MKKKSNSLHFQMDENVNLRPVIQEILKKGEVMRAQPRLRALSEGV